MRYLRNCWYVAAWSDEVSDGLLGRTILDEPVVLFRDQAGRAVALRDRCPHRFVPLSMGRRTSDGIMCGYHGLTFGPTGACVANPHGPITRALSVTAYPAVERHQQIWLWMGDPALADPAQIPNFSFLDDTSLRPLWGYMRTNANYELMTDNIMDLGHIEFLHPDTLGSEAIRHAKTTATREGNTVHSMRTVHNETLSPFMDYTFETGGRPVTRRLNVRWDPPASMMLTISAEPAGPEQGLRETYGSHIMTPETADTCHYFWSTVRNYGPDSAELDNRKRAALEHAFLTEDKPMIEAQAAAIGSADLLDLSPALLKPDAAAVIARRVLRQLIEAEGA
jgi:vanillate O-demethylase monooxygenase subunit